MDKLTLKEYILKLAEISERGEKTSVEAHFYRDKVTDKKLKAYDHYLAMATNGYAFDECAINFSDDFSISFSKTTKAKGYFTEFWFVFYDLKEYLLKKVVPERFFEKGDTTKVLDNAMIIPKIVQAMGVDSAKYYVTDFWDEDFNDETTTFYFASPNFLKEDEKLLSLFEIISVEDYDIKRNCIDMYNFFIDNGYDKDNVKDLIKEYIKRVCISKMLKNTDESNTNFSVIIQEDKKLRMSPMYDYDFCCGNIKRGIARKNVEGKSGFEDFINFFKKEQWFIDWLKKDVLSIDYEKIITDYNGGINSCNITPEMKKEYIDFFRSRMQIIQQSLGIQEEQIKV